MNSPMATAAMYFKPTAQTVQQPPPVYYTTGSTYQPPAASEPVFHREGPGEGDNSINVFSDRSIRRGFIRKVYSILTVQLLFTALVIAVFIFVEPVKVFVARNRWVEITAILIFLVTVFTLICVEPCRRKVPTNYICLGIFTMAESYLAAAMSSKYETRIVLYAVAITAFTTFSLTIFSIQTKIDFTMCSGCLCVSTLVVLILGIGLSVAFFAFGYSKILDMALAAIVALLFSMYLVYDTQMLMGGRRFALSEEEYVMAAIQLYLDIVMIFTSVLQIFGSSDS